MNSRKHVISGAFVFLLLGVFAVLCTMLVLFGAQAYRATVDLTAMHNEQRIVESFVRNAVRADAAEDAVTVRNEDDLCVLTIGSNVEGEDYARYIYLYEGMLTELYTSAGNDFRPERGESICALSGFRATVDNGLLTLNLTDTEGIEHTVQIALVCAQ